jgi:CheY-like chemotaxis protein
MKKILVVDDNDLNITILEGILENRYEIHVCHNGLDAITLVETKAFDMIIMDIMMPDMDGIEVCETIKKNDEKKDIPIIFLSAAANDKPLRQSVFKAGATDFINKPFKADYLIARIDSIFMNHV